MNIGEKGLFYVIPKGKIRIKRWKFQSEMLQKAPEECRCKVKVGLPKALGGKGPGATKCQGAVSTRLS